MAIGSPPLGGTFTLAIPFPNGTAALTPPLPFDVSSDKLKAEIDKVHDGRDVSYVEESGYTWQVTFHGVSGRGLHSSTF